MLTWISDGLTAGPPVLDEVSDFRLRHIATEQYLDGAWWSVLVELENVSIDQFEASLGRYQNNLLIPVAYDPLRRAEVRATQPVAIYAQVPLIDALNRIQNPYHVASLHVGAAVDTETLNFDAAMPDLSPIVVSDETVVMAVVDHGIAIAHDLFRRGPVESRIEQATILGAQAGGHGSVGLTIGRAEIDQHLCDWTHNDMLDEDGFYSAIGILDWSAKNIAPIAFEASHGTHVIGLAGGAAMDSACEDRPLICVSLPSSLVEDTSGSAALPTLYLAFQILMTQARRFVTAQGVPAPVIFNLSFGNSGGPHDGTGPFAAMFDYEFGPRPDRDAPEQKAWLTLPAGNLNLSRLHARCEHKDSVLDLIAMPDDYTPSIVEMWMPTGPAQNEGSRTTFRVIAPSGQGAQFTAQPGRKSVLVNDDNEEIARLACEFRGGTTQRVLVTLCIRPTATVQAGVGVAPQGAWKIEIEKPETQDEDVIEVWIRRDETLPGLDSKGRQAWFGNEDYRRFGRFGAPLATDPPQTESPIRRAGTISGFACGKYPIVVAGYVEREAEEAPYSGQGPLAKRNEPPEVPRDGPDLAAKSDNSYLLRGELSAGSRSGSWVRLSGTSVAAPRVAAMAADAIRGWQGSAREWARHAVHSQTEELNGNPTRGSDSKRGLRPQDTG